MKLIEGPIPETPGKRLDLEGFKYMLERYDVAMRCEMLDHMIYIPTDLWYFDNIKWN